MNASKSFLATVGVTTNTLHRWLWVTVATLAVARVFAQTPLPDPVANAPGRAALALSQDAQTPSTASNSQAPEKPPTSAAPSPSALIGATEPSVPTGTDSAAAHTTAPATPKKSDPKYDITQIGNRNIGKGVNFYSLEKEQRLGRELAAELEQEVHLLDDALVTEYVNRVGQNLVRNSDAKLPFTIKVVDDDEINAFALPGGYFYVNSGLIMAADNEAELAGVMAHEIAHVCARHATRSMTKGRIWNLASIPLIFVGGGAGYAVRQLVALSVPMSFLKFSRDAEREADFLGIEYQYAAGYDPSALVQFLEKINAMEKLKKHRFVAKLFSTHPMTEDRIRRAQTEIAMILPPRDEYLMTTSEFDEVKSQLAKDTLKMKRKDDDGKPNRPTLRRRTPQAGDPANAGEDASQADGDEHDHPPTLKRESD